MKEASNMGQRANWPPKVVIITSDNQRHRFFANRIARDVNLAGIVAEQKRPGPASTTAIDEEAIRKHFKERGEAESRYFAGESVFRLPSRDILAIENGETNSSAVFDWVAGRKPDYVLLFGSSIVRDPLLSHFDSRIINMHLGLSPYYRGSGTNFWPLVNCEPQCVGVTVHLAVLKVDAGAMLGQARPKAAATDRCHDLGCKTIIEGAELALRCLKSYNEGSLSPVPQPLGGRLYRARDFTAEAVRRMWSNLESGMVGEMLAHPERAAAYPIIEG